MAPPPPSPLSSFASFLLGPSSSAFALPLFAWTLIATIIATSQMLQLASLRSSLAACQLSMVRSSGPSFKGTPGYCNDWLTKEGDPKTDPWRYQKWIPRSSECRVNGMIVEELEPSLQFRRGGRLPFWYPALLPFLRGFQDPSLAKRRRRVLLDLGANVFSTSVSWFCHEYPLDFTEIYAFEVNNNTFKVPPPMGPWKLKAAEVNRTFNAIANWQLSRIKSFITFVGTEDGPNKIDITRFIKKELKLTPGDAVIVKMDIEGAEWDILPVWLSDPDMASIVDELFVEVHYNHPMFEDWGWKLPDFKHTQEDAINLMQTLRAGGFVTHFWP